MNKLINRKKKKGFTLIELIVVIAILGILAAILVPNMLGIINNANDKVDNANARAVYSAAQAYCIENSPVAADTYDTAGNAVYDGVKAALGSGFSGAFSFVVGSDGGVTSAIYNDKTYTPPAAPTTTAA
jgi:type IV pilus assembly protein PilA